MAGTVSYISYPAVAITKIPEKATGGKKDSFCFRLVNTVHCHGGSWLQEVEAAGDAAFTVRKQR